MEYGLNAPQDHIKELFGSGRKFGYKKGEIIQRANETPRGVYFLSEGYIKEYTISKDGTEHFHVLYGPGELFSVIWAFLNIKQNVYREAFTDVVVMHLEADDVKKAMEKDHELMHEINNVMMRQIFSLKARVENLAFNNAYDKVAYRLLYLTGRLGVRHDEGWYIPLAFRHQQIADAVSVTRETASRMIERMERQGLIKQDGKGHFIIRDPSGLARTMGVEEVMNTWPHLINK
jgi:CRP/FNR family transcriptional regulator